MCNNHVNIGTLRSNLTSNDGIFSSFQIVYEQQVALQMAHAVTFHLLIEEKFTRTLVQPMVMVVFHGAIQHQTMQVYQSGETVC